MSAPLTENGRVVISLKKPAKAILQSECEMASFRPGFGANHYIYSQILGTSLLRTKQSWRRVVRRPPGFSGERGMPKCGRSMAHPRGTQGGTRGAACCMLLGMLAACSLLPLASPAARPGASGSPAVRPGPGVLGLRGVGAGVMQLRGGGGAVKTPPKKRSVREAAKTTNKPSRHSMGMHIAQCLSQFTGF